MSYTKNRNKDFEIERGVWVYLKIFPMKGVMKFRKKGKLIPLYVGGLMRLLIVLEMLHMIINFLMSWFRFTRCFMSQFSKSA